MPIEIPPALADTQRAEGGAWVRDLPALVDRMVGQWSLRFDGPVAHGMAGLVLPVVRDGVPAVLKLQPVEEDNADTAAGLRTWHGDGAVLLLDHDEPTGAVLLERLDATRPLFALEDDLDRLAVIADLLARLTAVRAPAGVRWLADVATAMLDQVPSAVPLLRDPAEQELVRTCAAAVAELVGEAGDRLLHWDLHDGNVLAGTREPWLAIDPQPLAGDPGFDLLPALNERWAAIVATGDVAGAVRYRFDLLTDRLGLDRTRATVWTLGRVLQNALWDIEDGKHTLEVSQVAIAAALHTPRARRP
ncbi:aminoglycoside phosphotransferase family protein [Actinophytocola algeriensis]|uniref:Streptomycin 6-kinase n=1 Tax=Actinophytocola algeriensis TaxID=1768010 RepID=A0A7W7VBY5_9PSEU|nr:aminoglycoside phosphotransferase family protein [Actinophytocola algeriensis]MBB4904486.1 streptomycin 6-kinase [Actinophytocola algeriensis]MBE1476655.1 streptomycin 6-kinase [Actinophytocola algeriensis]